MDVADTLTSQLTRDIPYSFLVDAMTPFLNMSALEELVVIAFHLRNVRGGKGERQLFRDMMGVFYEFDKSLVIMLLPLIPEFGYWKDVFYLSMTLPHLLGPAMDMCERQLVEDEYRVRLGYRPSMMAKYIPKQAKKYKMFANSFARQLYPDIACHSLRMCNMRKRISALNKLTGAVELKMCAKEWVDIEPRTIHSIARKRYELALMNTTKDGRARWSTEDRDACRQKFEEFLRTRTSYNPPPALTTASEEYNLVRHAVRFWIENKSLNTSV
jgi:hypothetical protein